MKKRLILSFFIFVFLAYGLFVNQKSFSIISEDLAPKNPSGWFDYKGVTHVHTNANLGAGSYTEIISAGQEANLDFLMFSDLRHFKRDLRVEGYHRKLLALVGNQVGYLDSRILVYDSLQRLEAESSGSAQARLADLLSQSDEETKNLLLILAHPFKQGYSWIGDVPPGLDGIEVINLKDVWQKSWMRSKLSFFWSALLYPFNAELALIRLYQEPDEALSFWDRVASQKKFVGLAGAEATARSGPSPALSIGFPSYLTSFQIVTNHLLLQSELTGNLERDKVKVMSALANGNFYFSLDGLGNPKGFLSFLQSGEQTFPMGTEIEFRSGMRIMMSLPKTPKVPFEFVVLKDGQSVMAANSGHTEYVIHEPGVYRIVVRVFTNLSLLDGHKWMTWIYTNPYYIRASGTSTANPSQGRVWQERRSKSSKPRS